MKKIFSFFTLLVFIIIAFVANPMMSFAMQDMSMKMKNTNISWCCDNKETKDPCNHECCYESWWLYQVITLNTTREENKKIKVKIKSFIDIYVFSLKLYKNKRLTKIISPPYLWRDIKNYSYKDLTKIIKSNT